MENNNVTITISAESIYMHSVSVISFYSVNRFEISLLPELEIIQVIKGKRKSENTILSQKGEGQDYIIEVSVIGMFNERKVIPDYDEDVLGNHYGMRFYPFISSCIKGTIRCSRKIDNVSIIIPDNFNFIFFQSEIKQNNAKSVMRQSFGKESSKYFFTWKDGIDKESKYELEINIPVRLGGRSILRIVQFPICYWIAALTGIAFLSFTEKASIVIGAVVTAWLFMLQRWDSSLVPQKDTILTKFYLLFGALLGVWGFSWVLFGIKAAFLTIPIIIIVYTIFNAISSFVETGELPRSFAKLYALLVIKNDARREKGHKQWSIFESLNNFINKFRKG